MLLVYTLVIIVESGRGEDCYQGKRILETLFYVFLVVNIIKLTQLSLHM